MGMSGVAPFISPTLAMPRPVLHSKVSSSIWHDIEHGTHILTGAHFWIIGDMNADHGRYSVSVDGGLFEEFSGFEPRWRGTVILYERRLALGRHQIVIRNEEDLGFCLDVVM